MKGWAEHHGPSGAVWVTEAVSAGDAQRLERKATFLSQVRHPGVVDLVDAGPTRSGAWQLRARWVGPSVAELERRPAAGEVAGLGAAVANTVGDLHALGWVHGSIGPEHVLLDDGGRPVLCGLGAAVRSSDPADQAADTADVIGVLSGLVGTSAPTGEWRRLDKALRGRRRPTGEASLLARRLAAPRLAPRLLVPGAGAVAAGPAGTARAGGTAGVCALPAEPAETAEPALSAEPVEAVEAVLAAGAGEAVEGAEPVEGAEAALPVDAAEPAEAAGAGEAGRDRSGAGAALEADDARRRPPPGRYPSRPRAALAAASAAALVALGAAVVHLAARGRVGCPTADAGCRPVGLSDGVLTTPTGRFAVGAPGDTVVLGRWDCGPVALPAVLRPADGELWVFDRWPTPGSDIAGRAVGRVTDATSLAVVPRADGCDALRVARAAGAAVQLEPGTAR